MAKQRILVVDDEETLCEALRFNLEAEGYEVDVAYDAESALAMPLETYSLVLLDIMMGDISGLKMARIMKARTSTSGVPVIFCTAMDAEDDMLEGFEIGADDYITKPYSIKNVLARVKAVLRRSAPAPVAVGERPEFRGLSVDMKRKACFVDGREVTLPRKELEILALLLEHKGEILSRETILDRVWRDEAVVLDRVVDVNITRLRRKIGAYSENIVTRSGYGYGFME